MVVENVGATLNAMEFTADGKMVAIGDAKGQVHIYELGEVGNPLICTPTSSSLLQSLYQPSPDEAVKLTRTLKELQHDEQ